jgi:hypothetical protein
VRTCFLPEYRLCCPYVSLHWASISVLGLEARAVIIGSDNCSVASACSQESRPLDAPWSAVAFTPSPGRESCCCPPFFGRVVGPPSRRESCCCPPFWRVGGLNNTRPRPGEKLLLSSVLASGGPLVLERELLLSSVVASGWHKRLGSIRAKCM